MGFWEPVNKMFMDAGDPRQISGFVAHQDFTHPKDPDDEVQSPDDIEGGDGRRERLDDLELDFPTAQCMTNFDRTEPYKDEHGQPIFDRCVSDNSLWYKKSNTYHTGMGSSTTLNKMEMVAFAGYEELPADITGGDGVTKLVVKMGAEQLLGEGGGPQVGLSDGRWFPPLNTVTECLADR
jgi:hypothetical protein